MVIHSPIELLTMVLELTDCIPVPRYWSVQMTSEDIEVDDARSENESIDSELGSPPVPVIFEFVCVERGMFEDQWRRNGCVGPCIIGWHHQIPTLVRWIHVVFHLDIHRTIRM